MKKLPWYVWHFTLRGWEIDIDLACWWTHFHRGETGWYWAVGPFMFTTPDYGDWHGN